MGMYSPDELANIAHDQQDGWEDEPTPWETDDIKALLMRNDEAVGRALLAIHARQTFDEQEAHDTTHVNGRGFNSFDAKPMSGMSEWFRDKGFLTAGQLNWLRGTTAKAKVPRICKYAAQLTEVANGGTST